VARAALHNNTKQPPALQEGSVCVCFDTYAWGLQLIHGDGSRSSCVSMRYVAQPGRFSLVRSVAAEPRCNSAHQDADYWSLLLHHSALSSSPAVRTHYFSSVPRRYAHLSLVQRRQPPAQQTVSRYVLCLICFGNTDHIIVIVQSCAAQEAAEGVAGAPPLLHGVKGRGGKREGSH